jgi:hypothetical protein
MAIVDTQVRRAAILLLRDAANWLEDGGSIPIECFGDFAFVMHEGARFNDAKTGQTLHAVVYVGLSENEETSDRVAQLLKGASSRK